MRKTIAIVAAGIIFTTGTDAQIQPPPPTIEVRLALISYDDPLARMREQEELFADFNTRRRQAAVAEDREYKELVPRVAVGTYAEVLDWVKRGLVDVAILSPGAFAETDEGGNTNGDAARCRYLATQGRPWLEYEWSYRPPSRTEACFEYYSVCMVKKNSSIKTIDDLRSRAAKGEVQFIFTDPLSASGTILPMKILKELGISYKEYEFSFGHRDSLDLLSTPAEVASTGEQVSERVAFVYERATSTTRTEDLDKDFRHIEIPQLAGHRLPMEVWVAREKYPLADELRALLFEHCIFHPDGTEVAGFRDFLNRPYVTEQQKVEYQGRLQDIRGWGKDQGLAKFKASHELREIYWLMQHYERVFGKKSRLALVLSGGGAKCAYQAGAVREIERIIDATPLRPGNSRPFSIDLVVGTSGGALNALPIAMGLGLDPNHDPKKPTPLEDVWKSLDVRDLLAVHGFLALCLGITLAGNYMALVLLVVALHRASVFVRAMARQAWKQSVSPPPSQPWPHGGLLLALALPPLVLLFMLCSRELVLKIVSTSTPLFMGLVGLHLGLGRAVILLGAVTVALFVLWKRKRASTLGAFLCATGSGSRRAFACSAGWLLTGSLGLCVGVMFTLVRAEGGGSLFGRELLENAMRRQYAKLFQAWTDQPLGSTSKLEDISNVIVEHLRRERGPRKALRDLVISGSCLKCVDFQGNSEKKFAGDKYFYLPLCDSQALASYGSRGVEILTIIEGHTDHQHVDGRKLLNLTLGSGTIFPIFPAHSVSSFPTKDLKSELIDGGFTHNSPVEAAIEWGATHVIVIDASPEAGRPSLERSLWHNAMTAFGYLYDQAQITDLRAVERAAVFRLRPSFKDDKERARYPNILAFTPEFAAEAIDLGRRNAAQRSFQREPAAPRFLEVPLPH